MIALAAVCQIFLVVGQLLLKRAMAHPPIRWGVLALGTASLTAWFFLWLALLARYDLSRLFPFEGLNPALVVLGAAVFLRERVPARGWVGIGLISAGVMLVSGS
jgi:undecaprenyl phosphate-alpha-L-ara4N flippase subunit ArnE